MEFLKYSPLCCAYSERVWQGYVGHDVLVDVGLTWRIFPLVSEGRANRTAVTMKVSMPWWGAIVMFKLLGKIKEKLAVSCHTYHLRISRT